MKCRFTGQDIPTVHSFGMQPIANGFLKDPNITDEYFFKMDVAVNLDNGLFQLVKQPNPEQMFHENYAFFSRTSNFMVDHFNNVAQEILGILSKNKLPGKEFVVEIGSNDGVMLEHIVKSNIGCLGIEPSKNVAEESEKYGVTTINEFLSSTTAEVVSQDYGLADVVYAANVFCHIPDINDLAESCNKLLKDKGYLIFEDPYLLEVLKKTSYDQIYDEHVYLFSATAVREVFKKYDLTLVDCKELNTHGGSMRYYLQKNSNAKESKNLSSILDDEINFGIKTSQAYENFSKNCSLSREIFRDKLFEAKRNGQRIIGYGATSKSTTILNYCDVGNELIDFITDTTPTKINKFTPGKHIPVKAYENFFPYPDLAVLFAWNHEKEIIQKESAFIASGGRFITHLLNN